MSVNKVKVIANYLPQYHTIPENDKWWGKGFTDWIAVKATEPAYEGHNQPRVPLNENYYSLDCADSIRWQASLAREYGTSSGESKKPFFRKSFKKAQIENAMKKVQEKYLSKE